MASESGIFSPDGVAGGGQLFGDGASYPGGLLVDNIFALVDDLANVFVGRCPPVGAPHLLISVPARLGAKEVAGAECEGDTKLHEGIVPWLGMGPHV